jgi:hypothetical protein
VTLLEDIATRAGVASLYIAGVSPVVQADGLPPDIQTVVLLGPDETGFWPAFTETAEYGDGASDALDRWSRRVVGRIACNLGAKAYFPFGGAPYRPFLAWALRSGRCWSSPVGILVHETSGLFVSFRGAIGLREALPASHGMSPCITCADQPCRKACPAQALTPGGYDVPACKSWLETDAGQTCATGGCLVRRACPIGATRRVPAQSAFHMKAFHPQ